MAAIGTTDDNFQHFTAAAGDTVTFARATSGLILSTAVGTVTISFDGENGSFTLQAGTHQFNGIRVSTIVFGGAGAISGAGLCY